MKRIIVLLMAICMIAGFLTGCADTGGDATPPPATPAPTPAPVDDPDPAEPVEEDPEPAEPPRHLGGIEIIVADWWSSDDPPGPPQNLREEQQEEFLTYLEEVHGFTVRRVNQNAWGDGYIELFTNATMAQDDEVDIWIMNPDWAFNLMLQGMLYPLNTLESLDLSDPKWNQAVTDAYTLDGNVYAISHEMPEPRDFLFFNKRLFEEAGIDPNEPYELQDKGEWTWEKFEEYCEKLTRDTNGDGIPDTYAYRAHEPQTLIGFVYSNGGKFIGQNPDGTYYNAMEEPNFVEAVEFFKGIYNKGYMCPAPDGAEWDWHNVGFMDGHFAMLIDGAYRSSQWRDDMADPTGMVYVPKGPKATNYNTPAADNAWCLPFNIDPEKAEAIMFAYDMWTTPLPYDVENPDFWKDGAWGYGRFTDSQAVDSTLSKFYGDGLFSVNYKALLPGISWGEVFDWGIVYDEETAIEAIDAALPVVDAAIAEANK